ncbi:phosphatase [Hungatella hathewayi]|uniref:phosphatase n=1 Tax=Hungatella hathewayi TaxID=154046 RepID=UPI0035691388
MKYDYRIDLHTHTLASGHAYQTINEMILSASGKGMQLLGITEHGPAMPGGANRFYFQNMNILNRKKYGVNVLYGAELNIIDLQGNTDLDEASWRDLDLCIASLHHNCITPGSAKENTRALTKAMEHPRVCIAGHPDDGHFPLDYDFLIRAARDNHILVELNNSSLNPKGFRIHAFENNVAILKLCMKMGVDILLSSDAHREEDIGEFSRAQTVLEYVGFPEELIVNASAERLKTYLPMPRLI